MTYSIIFIVIKDVESATRIALRTPAATSTGSAGSVGSASSLHAGDVLFFYTQRIHRAPPPPPAGSPRYTLFGAFCRQGKTEGAPLLADTWERIWGAFSN